MAVIVLMLVSFVLIGAMVVAVVVTAHHETNRARFAELATKDLVPSFNFIALAPLDPRFDAGLKSPYMKVLTGILVSDYLESADIRRAVDEVLPPRVHRRDRPFNPNPPSG
jgi:hypothetical protein